MRTNQPTPPNTAFSFALFGELERYVAAPNVTDVLVNHRDVWIDDGSGLRKVNAWLDEPTLTLAQRIIAAGGRHVDEVSPIAGADVAGLRVQVILPPAAPGGVLIAIRKPSAQLLSLDDLIRVGTLEPSQVALIRAAAQAGESLLISGGTGSGKTTLLRAIMAELPATQRMIAVEDVRELRVPHPHFVSLQARQSNVQGRGAIEIGDLITAALRLRPDWLLVGECRGPELLPFMLALNTGHMGGGTIHANSLADLPARLEMLGQLAGLTPTTLARQAASAFRWCIHLHSGPNRTRLARVARLRIAGETLRIEEVPHELDRGLV